MPVGTEKNHEKPQSGYPVSGPRFEAGISRIRSRSNSERDGCESEEIKVNDWFLENRPAADSSALMTPSFADEMFLLLQSARNDNTTELQ